MKAGKNFFLCLYVILILICSCPAHGLEIPELKGRVNDYADILSDSVERQIETFLMDLERSDSTQIVVLTIPSLEGETLEQYSIRVMDKWKIGQKGLDNGAMLLISRNDRKIRIEVGYGLEGSLTDLISGRIIRDIIAPRFKAGDFDKGVMEGIQAMTRVVRGEFRAEGAEPAKRRTSSRESNFILPIVFIYLISMVGRVRRPLGAVAGGILFPLMGAMFFNPGLLLLLGLIPLGALAGFLISLFGGPLSFGAPHSRGGIGRIGSGRRFSGGGGFGGFSGGGGGFGGGGSSGGW